MQHGMYARLDPVMAEMIVVDLWAFSMGGFLIVHLWREKTHAPGRVPAAGAGRRYSV
jgi:hypothetical protein